MLFVLRVVGSHAEGNGKIESKPAIGIRRLEQRGKISGAHLLSWEPGLSKWKISFARFGKTG